MITQDQILHSVGCLLALWKLEHRLGIGMLITAADDLPAADVLRMARFATFSVPPLQGREVT